MSINPTCINNFRLLSYPTGNPPAIKSIKIACGGIIFKVLQIARESIPSEVSALRIIVAFIFAILLLI